MTSKSTFPLRFTKIDDLTRTDHYYLDGSDTCYFLGEYTARKDYSFSATNGLVKNFKKGMEKQGMAEWFWKNRAIQQCAHAFRAALDENSLSSITFVPVPPSKCRTDAMYDDRMVQTLQLIRPNPPLDIREMVLQQQSTHAVHEQDTRPTVRQLQAGYTLDEGLLANTRPCIAIVDDVLTTGCHFKAIQGLLLQKLPTAQIIGLFIARRAPEVT